MQSAPPDASLMERVDTMLVQTRLRLPYRTWLLQLLVEDVDTLAIPLRRGKEEEFNFGHPHICITHRFTSVDGGVVMRRSGGIPGQGGPYCKKQRRALWRA